MRAVVSRVAPLHAARTDALTAHTMSKKKAVPPPPPAPASADTTPEEQSLLRELQTYCRHPEPYNDDKTCRVCGLLITPAVLKQRAAKDYELAEASRRTEQERLARQRTDSSDVLQAGQIIERTDKTRWRVEYVNGSRAYIVPLSSCTVVIHDDETGEDKSFNKRDRGVSIAPNAAVRIISPEELSAEEKEQVETMAKQKRAKKEAKPKKQPVGDVVFTFKKETNRDDILPAGLFVLDAIKKIGSGTAEQIGRNISKLYKGTQKPTRMAAYWCNQFLRSGHVSAPKEQLHGRVLASLERGDKPVWEQNSRPAKKAKRAEKKASKKSAPAKKSAKPAKKAAPKKKAAKKKPAAKKSVKKTAAPAPAAEAPASASE